MKRRGMFIVSILALLLTCSACSDGPAASYNATPTTAPSVATTTAAKPAADGKATVGALVATFVAKYGTPNVASLAGQDYFSLYGVAGKADLTVNYYGDNKRVFGITLAAPPGHSWQSEAEAKSACLSFLPGDAVYQRRLAISNGPGIQFVYVAPSLAPLFPASVFSDENGNAATPGIIADIIDYDVSSRSTTFLECIVQLGMQAT